MRYVLWLALLPVLGVLAVCEADALAQVKPADKEQEAARARARLIGAAYLEGQLVVVDGEEKRFGIQVSDKVQVINTKMQEKIATAQKNYASAAARRDAPGMTRYAKEANDATAKLYDTKEVTYDFDLKGIDKMAVRTLITPTKDDGSKLSQAELFKLKGTSGQPGYHAELGDLTKGTWVRAYLDRAKLPKKDDAPLPVSTLVIEPAKEKPAPPKK